MAYSEASKRATMKYQREHMKQIPLRMKFDEYEELKQAADQAGIPVATFIKQAIRLAINQAAGSESASPAAGVPVGDIQPAGAGRVTHSNSRK